MCTSIYLGALSAMTEMARAVGQDQEAAYHDELAQGSNILNSFGLRKPLIDLFPGRRLRV
jgi:hypothetical protein